VSGALWAAASGVGFGLFQSVNRRAVLDIEDSYVSTFIQLVIAALVLVAATLATEDVGTLADAPAWSLAAFAAAGVVHFLLGWTFLNISQRRIGAARTSPLLTMAPVFGLVLAFLTLGEVPSAVGVAAILPMIAGAYLVAGGGEEARGLDAIPGLACAFMWALSPILTVEALEGLDSPLLGVTLGMLASVAAYAVFLAGRGTPVRMGAIARHALAFKLGAGLLVALATWWRWLALDDASIGAVLALALLSVPIVLFLSPLLVGRHLERVTARVWGGSLLVVAGSLILIAVE
jgi:drug/metabolite transporter (DMT)-like permease